MIVFLIPCFFLAQTYQTSTKTLLMPNLVVDPFFSTPQLPTGSFYDLYPPSLYAWNCTNYCQIDSLKTISANQNLPYDTSSKSQCIDLDSVVFFQNLSQHVLITVSGKYLLSVTWLRSLGNPLGKSFAIYINSTQVASTTVTSTIFRFNTIQLEFEAPKGILKL